MSHRPIIVSFTTWPARIHFAAATIGMMLNQTRKPDQIILNLSKEEFPDGMRSLPTDLAYLISAVNTVSISWIPRNTKAFKKLIPTLDLNRNNDRWIATVDDDVIYYPDYLGLMESYAEVNFGSVINPGIAGNWLHGAFGFYHPSYFGKEIFEITEEEMELLKMDDFWYANCYHRNGIKDKTVKAIQWQVHLESLPNPLGMSYNNDTPEFRKQLVKKIFERFDERLKIES